MTRQSPRIEQLLSMHEWQVFECKRATVRPGHALIPVVALANTEGGMLVLGLDDPEKNEGGTRLFGIKEHLDNVGELLNLISKSITPPITGLRHEELPILNRHGQPDHLVIFDIPQSTEVHSTQDGDTYIRRGRSNRKPTAAEIVQIKYTKGELHVEDEPVPDATFDDLDMTLLQELWDVPRTLFHEITVRFYCNE